MPTDYSGGQISRMVENVVLIKYCLIYGTMPSGYEKKTCKNSMERSHTLEPRTTKPYNIIANAFT